MVVLVVAALVSGLLPGLAVESITAARRFVDTEAYQAAVLDNRVISAMNPGTSDSAWAGIVGGLVSAACAVAIAMASLFADRLPPAWRDRASRLGRPTMVPLHTLHSGKVGDYVAWLTVGVALFGIVLAMWTGLVRP